MGERVFPGVYVFEAETDPQKIEANQKKNRERNERIRSWIEEVKREKIASTH